MKVKFTDSKKWSDNWFRKLTPNQKLVWIYLIDNCDIAGFIEIDYDYIAFHIGITPQEVETAIKGLSRGYIGANDGSHWVWIHNYIKVQRNLPLNPKNNSHKGIINSVLFQSHRFSITEIAKKLGANEGLFSPTSKVKVEYSNTEEKEISIYQFSKQQIEKQQKGEQVDELLLAVSHIYKLIHEKHGEILLSSFEFIKPIRELVESKKITDFREMWHACEWAMNDDFWCDAITDGKSFANNYHKLLAKYRKS